jgi:hypothetical protein
MNSPPELWISSPLLHGTEQYRNSEMHDFGSYQDAGDAQPLAHADPRSRERFLV